MSRIYGKLEPTRAEIRVLTIDPDTIFDSPLQCSLRVVSLNVRPQFEALSYVWGEDSIKKTIAIDGDPWPVSGNLELALRYLRHSDAPRTLWVDAVCINQVDTDEKNFQIPLMSRIYSDCVNVIAWLGAANSNIEAAIAWAKRYVPDKSSSKMQPLDLDAEFPAEDSEQRNLAAFAVVDGIHALATSPYWARVWTFQEYRLAKEEPICICGHLIFRASIFDVEGVGKLQLAVAGIVAYITKPSLQLHLSEDKKAITDAVGYFLMEVNHGGNKFSEHILCHLLQMTAKRRCSDDRDKVYGLYGMMPKAQKAYPADYRKPAKQVLLEASAYMINEELGASVFTYFPLRDGRLSDLSYPSWAPDLARAEINLQLKTVPPSLRFWTGSPTPPPPSRISSDFKTLHFLGRPLGSCRIALRMGNTIMIRVGQIADLLHSILAGATSTRNNPWAGVRNARTLATRLALAPIAHWKNFDKPASAMEILDGYALLRDVMIARNRPADHPMWPNGRYSIKKLFADAFQDAFQNSHVTNAIFDAAMTLQGKTFVVTDTGLFGICTDDIKHGDVVLLPIEAELPLFVRREPGTTAEPGGNTYYRLVGSGYVDGIIEGPCLDESLVMDIVKRDLRPFNIH